VPSVESESSESSESGEVLGLGYEDWPLPSDPSSLPSVVWSLARSFFRPGASEPPPPDGDPGSASGDGVDEAVEDEASGDAPSAPQPPRSRQATTPITATRTGLVFI